MDSILILDFGSQTTALIGRRIREMGIHSVIIPGDVVITETLLSNVKGIILSGSPESVYKSELRPDKAVYQCGLPLFGICYGLQCIISDHGGNVEPLPQKEFGAMEVSIAFNGERPEKPNWYAMHFFEAFLEKNQGLLSIFSTNVFSTIFQSRSNKEDSFTAWMSHGDTISKLPSDFIQAGKSASGYPAIVYHKVKPWFGVQFHPEVSHCERGGEILSGFILGVCNAKKDWNIESYLEKACADLCKKAGASPVLLLISGGVDSTVAAAMLLKALPSEQIHLMYLDTGLMRKNETEEVSAILQKLGAQNIHIVDCADIFFTALKGKSLPEDKRKIIGDLFITVQEHEVERLKLPSDYFLAQGTLYTDLIESGKGISGKAHIIKSHHNVASPLVEAKRAQGRILEPLSDLYKDEVRALGRLLNLDSVITGRHPFPGPGLAVRILGEVTPEKCKILREADSIFINELKKRCNTITNKLLYEEIWQAFAVLLPVKSVGIAGDGRSYGETCALRAVISADGMTADVYPFLAQDILEISAIITNTVPQIGRVVLDISSKPPATIEWE